MSHPVRRARELQSPLAKQLIIGIILVSSVITLVLTAGQLYDEYSQKLEKTDADLRQIEQVHLESLSRSLWATNTLDLQLILNGLVHAPNLEYAAIREGGKLWAESGHRTSTKFIERQYPMTYTYQDRKIPIGTLIVVASLDTIYRHLWNRTFVILASNAIKTILVAVFAFILFHRIVSRHLLAIADYLRDLRPGERGSTLKLARAARRRPDELDDVAAAINSMNENARLALIELRESKEKLRLFVRHAPSAIAMFDRDMRYVAYSQCWLADFRLPDQDIIGRSHYDVFPDIPEHWKEIHRNCLGGAVEKCDEERFQHADRSVDWLRWEVHPWRDAQDAIGGIIIFSEVITARKRAEAERLQLLTALDASLNEIYMFDPDTLRFTYVNHGGLRNLGYSKEVMRTMTPLHLKAEFSEASFRELISPLTRGVQERLVFETTHRRSDATFYPVEVHLQRMLLTGNSVYLAIILDITQRKQTENVLRESSEKLALAVQAANVGLWNWDLGSNQVTYSREWKNQIGYEAHEIGDDYSEWESRVHPDDLTSVLEHIQQCLARSELKYQVEFRLRHKNGSYLWIYARGEVSRDGDGNPLRILGCHVDITERKRVSLFLEGQQRTQELISLGAPLKHSLDSLVWLIEAQYPDVLGSISITDNDGSHLRFGAAPSLPDSYNDAVDGLPIGPQAGSCGTAAYRREPVIVEDIATDPLWESYRHLALLPGLRACWSTPIIDMHKRLLGTFALYFRTPSRPTEEQVQLIDSITYIAAIAISKAREKTALNASNERLQTLSRQILHTQEIERRTIARELHDEIGGTLAAVKLNLVSLKRLNTEDKYDAALADGLDLISNAIKVVRSRSLDLHPAILDDLGLIPALRWYCGRQAERSGIPIALELDAIDLQREPQLETGCFRIVQEAVNNALRHANAHRIQVALRRTDDSFTIEIADDGVGFDVAAAHQRAHAGHSSGLLGMRERAGLLGGRFAVDSTPGAGARVTAEFSWVTEESPA